MAETTQASKKTAAKKTAKKAATRTGAATSVTAEERAAMKEHANELRTARQRAKSGAKADGDADIAAKIKEMPDADRTIAEQVHAIVKAAGPELESRTWYGMPAYSKDGKVVCFFQSAAKFKARYAMLGFSDEAKLDDGAMWPVYYAIAEMTPAIEKQIAALIKQAVS